MFNSLDDVWDTAVTRNTAALKVILATLVGLLTVYGGLDAIKVPRTVRSAILLVLRPAESALRRLIVIAARDVKVAVSTLKLKPSPPAPKERTTKQRTSRLSFPLFDPRKRFGQKRVTYASVAPRVFFIAPDPPFSPLFLRPPDPLRDQALLPETRQSIGARPLCLRLKAIAKALDDVSYQAKRLARLQVRRENRNLIIAPLRPGYPPGHRSKPNRSVDFILAECHKFAHGVLAVHLKPIEPALNTS
jgi:hypothetical protein